MLNKISIKLVNILCKDQLIDEGDIEIYLYGMVQFLKQVISILSLMILGVIFNEVKLCIVYITAFVMLRKFTGGYHAGSSFKCYILTVVLMLGVLSAQKYLCLNIYATVGMLILSSCTILALSPVESINKPLDVVEKYIYRRRVIHRWGIQILVVLIAAIMGIEDIVNGVVMAQVVAGASLICGKIYMYAIGKL